MGCLGAGVDGWDSYECVVIFQKRIRKATMTVIPIPAASHSILVIQSPSLRPRVPEFADLDAKPS